MSFIPTRATVYYVDAQQGNDANNGLAPSFEGGEQGPWQTLSKVNGSVFAPGDSILFKRGAVWTDGPLVPLNGGEAGGVIVISEQALSQPIQFELVDPNNHRCIYFGAYGGGDKPRIDCQGRQGLVIRHNYIIVENLRLDGGGHNVLEFERVGGNYWINVKDVEVAHADGNAVRFAHGGGNCWLNGLYVYDYRLNGIYLEGSAENPLRQVLVENCRIDDSGVLSQEDAISCHRDASGFNISGEIIIRNNVISRSGEDGIDITSGTGILLEGNAIDSCLSGGIYVKNPWVNTVEVRGNFLNSNSLGQGVGDLTIGASNVRAVNNIITGAGHHSLLVQEGTQIEIWHNVIAPGARTGYFIRIRDSVAQAEFRNNIFDFSATGQIIDGPLLNHSFDYNCYYGKDSLQQIYAGAAFRDLQAGLPSFEPNGFWADPLFVDPEKSAPLHFQLRGDSPCVDRGEVLPLGVDFWGKERPQGVGPEIGAYEAEASPGCPPAGALCDDHDPSTFDDVADGRCNCAGSPCPEAGAACDDGNPNTVDDREDGFCHCAGVSICLPAGAVCDDGDPSTYDDLEDGDCGCAGTPCLEAGTLCDDGDPNTLNDIEDGFCHCAGRPAVFPGSIVAQTAASADDAEETLSNGKIDLNSPDLELIFDGEDRQVVGIRFANVNIQQAAAIAKAHIQFTVDEVTTGASSVFIFGEDADQASSFTNAGRNISSRTKTSASVGWSVPDWFARGEAGDAQQTPDLSAIVQEIVNRPGWASGNALVFLFEGEGVRTAESYDGSAQGAPRLIVDFFTECRDAGTPCDDGDPATYDDVEDGFCHCAGSPFIVRTISAQVDRSNNDVEERTNGGRINLTSADLELGFAGTIEQNVGVRFSQVDIPPGAIISRAYLQFTAHVAGAGPSSLTVYGEAADHASPFTVSAYNVSKRHKTAAFVEWEIVEWPQKGAAGPEQQTPDLSAILQEIVNRPGWRQNNAMVFSLFGSGGRAAMSYDGSVAGAPKLFVEYKYTVAATEARLKNKEKNTVLSEGLFNGSQGDQAVSQMTLWPNPVDQAATLRIKAALTAPSETAHLFIQDTAGKIIRRESIVLQNDQWTDYGLEVSRLNPGLYFVALRTGAEVLIRRLVKVGY